MNAIRVTKCFSFEMAHALDEHKGKCNNIHGHSYKLQVTILGRPIEDTKNPSNGMVIEFADLKRIVNENIIEPFDHALVLNQNSPYNTSEAKSLNQRLISVNYTPTCENLLVDFSKKLRNILPENVSLHSLKLEETANSFGEWFAEDN